MGYTSFALDDRLVLYHSGVDDLLVLNPSASLIWSRLAAGEDARAIAGELALRYSLDLPHALQDVQAALATWREAGLLEPGSLDAAPPPAASDPGGPGSPRPAAGPRGYRVAGGTPGDDQAGDTGSATWQATLFDKCVCLRCRPAELGNAVAPLLAHLSGAAPAGGDDWLLCAAGGMYEFWRQGRGLIARGPLARVLFALHSELIGLGCERDWLIAVHGAGVHDGARAILLPGSGGSGKSTLTAALLAGGLGYLSDDVVPIDRASRQAVPLPLALNLKPGALPVLEPFIPGISATPAVSDNGWTVHFLPPPGFAARPPERCYPVLALVFPKHVPGAPTRVRPIAAVEALQRLIEGESLLPRPLEPNAVGELIAWLKPLPAYRLEYDNLAQARDIVRALLP